jgi:ubiquinone/menaquinone biosynthesis C-methylase UbiE
MDAKQEKVTNYGNWVSTRIIAAPAVLAVILAASSLLTLFLLIPAVIFFLIAVYFAYARYLFSPRGGDVQEKVRNLILENLSWDGIGKALDIGCGSAALTIGIAQKFPCSKVVGTDYWGGNWEYSQKVCLENAEQQQVQHRVAFQKGSASTLPFADEEFDAVVSNLVFHEVKDTPDKLGLIKEALRVLKKGGKFTLQDLFYVERMFGKTEDLRATVRSWGVREVELIETRNSFFIPAALKLPFMVGTLGLLKGEK